MCTVNAQLLQYMNRFGRTFASTCFAFTEASPSVAKTQDSTICSRLTLNTSSSQAAVSKPSFVSRSSVIFVKLVLQILWPNWYCSPTSVFNPCVIYQVNCTIPHRKSPTHSTPNISHNFKFRVCKSVHHHTFKWINQPDAAISQVYYLSFKYSTTCFGYPHAHHQELNNCSSSLWFYFRSVVVAVLLIVVRPVRPRPTALLSPRSYGKTTGCYCSCWAPDDGHENARNMLRCI